MNPFFKLTLVSVAISLSACTVLESDKVDYRSASGGVKTTSLDIPPDLTQLSKDTHYAVVGGSVSASGFKGSQPTAVATGAPMVAAVALGDVRIERAGNQRWLVVNRPADKLWEPVKEFWQDNGFLLAMDQNTLGIMETDWAENRANLPQTGLRKLIGGALDMLYDTGTRDMFRTRMERTGNGTEIYISHRGMEEVYTSSSKDTTSWQPRASDPQLEGELLRRLMVRLGTNEAEASAALQASSSNLVRGATVKGNALILNDVPDNAWRRIGLSLDRVGLSVIDRDYTNRVYYITPNSDDRGLFKKSFGKLGESYQVQLKTVSANQTEVTFADRNGKMLTGDDKGLSKILKELQKTLK